MQHIRCIICVLITDQNCPSALFLTTIKVSGLFIFDWSLEGNTCLFLAGQKQKPQQQKSACGLDKESDAICAAFKAHTFRLGSHVSAGSWRCIHLQAAVVKIEAAAQIARITTDRHKA